jgi:hypothetical protein
MGGPHIKYIAAKGFPRPRYLIIIGLHIGIVNVNPDDIKAAKGILLTGEEPKGSVTQRRFGPGGSITSPTTVLVTDKRVIVINRAIFGLRHSYEVFSLTSITGIKLRHGFISSSVFIRTQGSESADKSQITEGKQEGEIFGLRKNEAAALANLINESLAKREASNRADRNDNPNSSGSHEFCGKCGAKLLKGGMFCKSCGTRI